MKRSEARCALMDSLKNRSWGESTADHMLDVLEEVGAVKWEPELPKAVRWCPDTGVVWGDNSQVALDLSLARGKYPEDLRRQTLFLLSAIDAYNEWGPHGPRREGLQGFIEELEEHPSRGWSAAAAAKRLEIIMYGSKEVHS